MLEVNKIHLGDCLGLMKNMPDKSVEMILTDIPYDVINRESNGLRNLNKGNADTLTFDLYNFLEQCYRICKGSIYIFCSTEQVSSIRSFFVNKKLTTRLGIWEKSNPSPMNGQYMWLSGVECCIYAKNKKAIFNEHCKNSVWRFSTVKSKIHDTQKPVLLFEYLIKASSKEDDVIFDPCIGSGTTAIAAINTKRNFIGIEKDEMYWIKANIRTIEYQNNISVT